MRLTQSQTVLGSLENLNLIDNLNPTPSELSLSGNNEGCLDLVSQLHRLIVVRVVKDSIRQPQLMCFVVCQGVEGCLEFEVLIGSSNLFPFEHNLKFESDHVTQILASDWSRVTEGLLSLFPLG